VDLFRQNALLRHPGMHFWLHLAGQSAQKNQVIKKYCSGAAGALAGANRTAATVTNAAIVVRWVSSASSLLI
jgi:hypothetical protein